MKHGVITINHKVAFDGEMTVAAAFLFVLIGQLKKDPLSLNATWYAQKNYGEFTRIYWRENGYVPSRKEIQSLKSSGYEIAYSQCT